MKWTEEEHQLLRDNFYKLRICELSQLLNKTDEAIRKKLNQLKLKHPTSLPDKPRIRNGAWSEEEIEILKQNYPTKTQEEILSLLSLRNWHIIQNYAHKLNLSREVGKPRTIDIGDVFNNWEVVEFLSQSKNRCKCLFCKKERICVAYELTHNKVGKCKCNKENN